MGPAGDGVLQIHPTRRCNLRCRHCYSLSGPEERDQLPAEVFARAIAGACEEGYQVASFSGGEPTLYGSLPDLLRESKTLGMRTTVTSNGMLLDQRRLEGLVGVTDLLAISLDGWPESHNTMRGSARAFDAMAACLPSVRASGLIFGFIFTLTQHNLNEAAWAADFACAQGAMLFQVHPLEEVGRAAQMLPGCSPDSMESGYGYLETERIRRQYEGRMAVHYDMVHAAVLRQFPERFFDSRPAMDRLLGELVSPLVIEADGRLVPFGYGFAERYSLGSIAEDTIPHLAARFRASGYEELQELCRSTLEEASCGQKDFPILNWWETLGRSALSQATAFSDPESQQYSGTAG